MKNTDIELHYCHILKFYFLSYLSKNCLYCLGKENQPRKIEDEQQQVSFMAERVKALLRPWIKRFTMIISAWWLRTSSKFSGKKTKKQPENSETYNS